MDVLIVGCGDLGSQLGEKLAAQGLQVTGLRRSAPSSFSGIKVFQGDVTRPETLAALEAAHPSILVYSVAADAQSDEAYQAQYVQGLQNTLARLLPSGSLRHVFFVSSTRPYGQASDQLLDENDLPIPADFGGQRLLEAESSLASLPCPSTVLRLSGIYGPGRTRMLKLASQPASWPANNTWTNRIHRDDAAAFMALLIQRQRQQLPLENLYLVTDSTPAPQHEVLHWIAECTHIGGLPETPPVSGGKRLSNTRMLATGFALRYPSYREGYAQLIQDQWHASV